MTELSTDYLGLRLPCPIVASSSPLTRRLDALARLEDAGVGAVVLPSLFEEEVVDAAFEAQRLYAFGADAFAEASNFFPDLGPSPGAVERHLQLVSDAKQRLSVPVIASINGVTEGGWLRYAADLEDAGADAIELNVYYVAADPDDTSSGIEAQLVALAGSVRRRIRVPLAVKLSPYFTALAGLARSLEGAGVDGLVLFNRFYQPDIDLESLSVLPSLDLSTSVDLRLPLRWVGILAGEVRACLALSGGVHTATDVVKALAAGADVAMTTASLLQHGPDHVATLRRGLERWLSDHEYVSAAELRGSMSRRAVPDPDAYERANYLKVIQRASAHYA